MARQSSTSGSPETKEEPVRPVTPAEQMADATEAVEAADAGPELNEAPSTPPASESTSATGSASKRNAFSTLMSSPFRHSRTSEPVSKRARGPESAAGTSSSSSQVMNKFGRNGLGAYLVKPDSFSSNVVLYHSADFVVIRDMYPKSTIHLLILPRTSRNLLHPFTAFQDQELLDSTKAEADKVRELVGEELRRLFGKDSTAERARREAIAAADEDGEIPPGRDWSADVIVGVHAGPSMNHLHVHVLSKDRFSECMRHRKHYNSFNTSFFVGLDEFPLKKDDPRWKADRGGGLKEDLKCWRCGQNFGNKFERLKTHLKEEFEDWKRQ